MVFAFSTAEKIDPFSQHYAVRKDLFADCFRNGCCQLPPAILLLLSAVLIFNGCLQLGQITRSDQP